MHTPPHRSIRLLFFLAIASQTFAQTTPSVQVDETLTTAQLAETAINFSFSVDSPQISEARLKVELWDNNGKVDATSEQQVKLRAGRQLLLIAIPIPAFKGSRKDVQQQLQWKRVQYSLVTSDGHSAAGILSLGAVLQNLFELRLAGPGFARLDQPYSVHVRAANPVTHAAKRGLKLSAQIEFENDANTILKARTRTTDVDGEVLFVFQIPKDVTAGEGTLTVKTVESDVPQEITSDFRIDRSRQLALQVDKHLYQPGQTVHLRALAFDGNRHALVGTTVTFVVKDTEDTLAFKATAKTNAFGIASVDWVTTSETPLSTYEIRGATMKFEDSEDAEDSDFQSVEEIKISRYDLPNFSVNAKPNHPYYMPGQKPEVEISANYLFGKPVQRGSVRVVREEDRRWNNKEHKYDIDEGEVLTGTLTADGKLIVHPNVEDEFKDLEDSDYRRFNDLKYAAYVTDASTGRTEQRRFDLRLTKQQIHIYRGRGRNTKDGATFYLTTDYADGTPAQCRVQVYEVPSSGQPGQPAQLLAEVKTNSFGLAKITVKLAPRTKPRSYWEWDELQFIATDKRGIRSEHTESSYTGEEEGYLITSDKPLYGPGESIRATVESSTDNSFANLEVIHDGVVLRTFHMRISKNKKTTIVVPVAPDVRGEVHLIAYSLSGRENQNYRVPQAMLTVLYPEDRELKVTLHPSKNVYRPGEAVEVNAHVSGASGAASGALGVTVIDKAVEERIRTDAEFDDRWGRYWWNWAQWGYGDSIAGVTLRDLNRIDATRPLPAGFDLVAEALLDSRYYPEMNLEGFSSDDHEEVILREAMDKSLAPLAKAMREKNFPSGLLPSPAVAVKNFAAEAGLPKEILLDSWGQEYAVEFEVQGSYFQLRFTSAGPDKKPGTPDDIALTPFQRDFFSPDANSLMDALKKAILAGEYFPDASSLLRSATQHGFDAAHALDPWGQPYTYKSEPFGSSYRIEVRSTGEPTKTAGGDRSFLVWQKYFSSFQPVEADFDLALDSWFKNTGHHVSSQAEFDKAIAASNFPIDKLRDPYGNPYFVLFGKEQRYGDILKIDANGARVKTQATPVTAYLAVASVMSAGPDRKRGTEDDIEVARFVRYVAAQGSSDVKQEPIDSPGVSGLTGAISGTVTDASGAVIANAQIKIQLQGTEYFITQQASETGRFLFRNLKPGVYQVIASSPAFQTYQVRDVPVVSSAATSVNITLRVGAASETVEVQATAATVQTTSSSVSSKADNQTTTKSSATVSVSIQSYTPRLREYFPETLYWNPSLETDKAGQARIKFNMADNITTWKMSVLASTIDGRVGTAEQEIQAFQPFFVEHDPPKILTQGDQITLPVVLRNYLPKSQQLTVELFPAPWFTLQGSGKKEANVPAGDSANVTFPFTATSTAENGKQKVSATNREIGDAIEKTVTVHPDGQEIFEQTASLMKDDAALHLQVPTGYVPGSLRAQVKVYPNIMAHVLEGVEGILERPWGCGEQTISSTYPSLLVMRYYSGQSTKPAIYAKAKKYAEQGYLRLLNYQSADGGFTYWGRGDADMSLTAYAVQFLTDAKGTIAIDDAVARKARQWLLMGQKKDGTFDAHYGSSTISTSYVARTLAETLSLEKDPQAQEASKQSIHKALTAVSQSAMADADPYIVANTALTELALGERDRAAAVIKHLLDQQQTDKNGALWELQSNTAFYGWGTAGRIETTALAIHAIWRFECKDVKDATCLGLHKPLMDGLAYLIHGEDRFGVWYSSHTTVEVLETLFDAARTFSDAGASGTVTVNGKSVGEIRSEKDQPGDAPKFFDATAAMKAGANEVRIGNAAGTNALMSAQLATHFYVPWQSAAEKVAGTDGIAMKVDFDKTSAKIGDTIRCNVEITRTGSRGYGMLLGEIGLPPGAEVDRESLDKIMAGNNWALDRYDILPDRLIVYVWPYAGGSKFQFIFRPRFAEKALTAPSTVYDYYNPDARVVLAPKSFAIQ